MHITKALASLATSLYGNAPVIVIVMHRRSAIIAGAFDSLFEVDGGREGGMTLMT